MILENVTESKEITVYFKPNDKISIPDYSPYKPTQAKFEGNSLHLEPDRTISIFKLNSILQQARAESKPYVNIKTGDMLSVKIPANIKIKDGLISFINIINLTDAVAVGAPQTRITNKYSILKGDNSISVTFCTPHTNFGAEIDISFPAEGIQSDLLSHNNLMAYYLDSRDQFSENKGYKVSYSPSEGLITIHGLTHASTYIISSLNLAEPVKKQTDQSENMQTPLPEIILRTDNSQKTIAETPKEDDKQQPSDKSYSLKLEHSPNQDKLTHYDLADYSSNKKDNSIFLSAGLSVCCIAAGLLIKKKE